MTRGISPVQIRPGRRSFLERVIMAAVGGSTLAFCLVMFGRFVYISTLPNGYLILPLVGVLIVAASVGWRVALQ